MDILYYLCLLLPTSVCIELAASFFARVHKTRAERVLLTMIIAVGLYTLVEVLYKTTTSYSIMVVGITCCSYLLPLLPALAIVYFTILTNTQMKQWQTLLLLSIPVIWGLACTILLMISGMDNATILMQRHMDGEDIISQTLPLSTRVFGLMTSQLLMAVTAAEAIGMVAILFNAFRKYETRWGQLYRFLFKGESVTPFYLMTFLVFLFGFLSIIRLVVPTPVFISYPWISVIYSICLTIVIHFVGHVGHYTHLSVITLKDTYAQELFIEAASEAGAMTLSDMPAANVDTMAKLQKRLVRLIETDGWFLHRDVSLESVSEELLTNRVYVSRVLNQNMNTTFRDYINRLRIEYAERWVVTHPDDDAATVADVCGFNSVNRFTLKFRQISGVTFEEWKAAHPSSLKTEV